MLEVQKTDKDLYARIREDDSLELITNKRPNSPLRDRYQYIRNVARHLRHTSKGIVCEFGIFKGQSLGILSAAFPDQEVYGFDSFEGLPESYRGSSSGVFRLKPEEVASIYVPDNAVLYKGLFSKTIPMYLEDHSENIGLLHVDCDVYSSTHDVLFGLADKIVPGTYIMFDEYFGYKEAVDYEHKAFIEFCREYEVEYRYIFHHIPHPNTDSARQATVVITKKDK